MGFAGFLIANDLILECKPRGIFKLVFYGLVFRLSRQGVRNFE